MTAVGFVLFSSFSLLSILFRASKLQAPEWLELLGGTAILIGLLLMISGVSVTLWRLLP